MQPLIKQEQLDVLKISQQELIEKFKYEEIHSNIMNALKKIDNKDFSKYQHVLYRIDISEKQLNTELNAQPGGDRYSILADLIIKRILQKIILKIQFSKK
jgi:hypothetical protein